MKRYLCVALLASLSGLCEMAPRVVIAQAYEPFLGEIHAFGFNFCPVGWEPANGALISISENTALFSLLGTSYGGDGKTTFALPAMLPVFAANGFALTQCIAVQGVFPSRS